MPLKKVLIIDDEQDFGLLLQSFFSKKNYKVLITNTLAAGAEIIKTEQPDLVVMDNNLPDGQGWNAAPELAARFPFLHFLLISAYAAICPKMPAHTHFGVLEKPLKLKDLETKIDNIQLA